MQQNRSGAGDGIVSRREIVMQQDFRIYIIIPIPDLQRILWRRAGGMTDDTGRDHRENTACG